MITSLEKVRDLLLKNKLDAIMITSISNIIYLTGYSGFSKEEREAYLFLTQDSQYILTDGRYTQDVKTLIPNYELIEISSKFSFEKALKRIIKSHKIKKLGFEGHDISFLEHERLSEYFNNIYHLSISSLRSIKTSHEISKIEKACKLGDKTFDYILKKIHLGVTEKEIAFEIEFFIKKSGGDISFAPIVAFGKNSAVPHHVPTQNSEIRTPNSIILLDFGVKLDNYCSDMTRTIFYGKPTSKQKRMYETVLNAQNLAIQQFNNLAMKQSKEQIQASNVDNIAREYIVSQGYKTIPHSLGHGIGIQIHESPRLSPKSKDILNEGMVFSVEPGIYIPNFGGVRIEDLVVLTNKGPKLLTHFPKEIIVL
jgi:Xaa-Pro aminopeptidase